MAIGLCVGLALSIYLLALILSELTSHIQEKVPCTLMWFKISCINMEYMNWNYIGDIQRDVTPMRLKGFKISHYWYIGIIISKDLGIEHRIRDGWIKLGVAFGVLFHQCMIYQQIYKTMFGLPMAYGTYWFQFRKQHIIKWV